MPRLCKTEGCSQKAKRNASYCASCLIRVRVCTVDDCLERISVHNRSGYCYDHRYIANKVKLLGKAGAVLLALWGGVAGAVELAPVAGPVAVSSSPPPCQRVTGGVLCDEESFGRLIGRCIGAEEDLGICRLRLAKTEADLARTEAARIAAERSLGECLARPLPEPVKVPVGAWKAPVALVLGSVGAAALMSAVALPLTWEGRTTAGVGGLVLLGAGVWVAW